MRVRDLMRELVYLDPNARVFIDQGSLKVYEIEALRAGEGQIPYVETTAREAGEQDRYVVLTPGDTGSAE